MLIVLQKMSLEIPDLQLSTRRLCIGGPEPPCHVGCGRAGLQLQLKKEHSSFSFRASSSWEGGRRLGLCRRDL